MLALPDKGMARSVEKHNVNLNNLCDWVEASVALIDPGRLSKSDIVDELIEQEVYDKQAFATEIVDSAWSVLSSRIAYLGRPLGITVSGNRISRAENWDKFPAYGFCLALACAPLYPKWVEKWGPASERGELFEQLAHESFSKAMSGWTVRRVGWSPGKPKKLRSEIASIIADLNEVAAAEMDLHVDQHANELGLDLLAYYSYGDRHASFPVLLVQCASGDNWMNKRHTPDIETWEKIISFNSKPVRGLAMPFAYAEPKEFRKDTMMVRGVFVDRNRLLGAFRRTSSQVSAELDKRISDWLETILKIAPSN